MKHSLIYINGIDYAIINIPLAEADTLTFKKITDYLESNDLYGTIEVDTAITDHIQQTLTIAVKLIPTTYSEEEWKSIIASCN